MAAATTRLYAVCPVCSQLVRDTWRPIVGTREPALAKETTYGGPSSMHHDILWPLGAIGKLGVPWPENWDGQVLAAMDRAAHAMGYQLVPLTDLDEDT